LNHFRWIQKISKEESQPIVFGLAGTKIDLPSDARKTKKEDVDSFCVRYSIDIHFEVSAKSNIMVEELFQELVETMVTRFEK
jgi:GTPase SAR1 family protein